jgi:hypothetical protein
MAYLGFKFSKESREKMRLSHLGQASGKKGKTYEEIYGIEKAKELKTRVSHPGLLVGDRNPSKRIDVRKKISLACRGKLKPWLLGNKFAYIDGSSKRKYPIAFNTDLKLRVRTRDNFTCRLCGKPEKEEVKELQRVLCVNHIDFNKENCDESNLNTLCLRCNLKINKRRDYWTNYFKNLNA